MSLETRLTAGFQRVAQEIKSVRAALSGKVDTTDSRLTDARTPTSHTHPISQVSNLQSTLDNKAGLWNGAITGGHLFMSPESGKSVSIPYFMNDISYNNLRGGATRLYADGVLSPTSLDICFEPTSTARSLPVSTTEYVIEVDLWKAFTYGTKVGYAAMESWRAKYIKIEAWDRGTETWKLCLEDDNSPGGDIIVPVPAQTGQGITKLRYTFRDFNSSSFRIGQLILINYSSEMGSSYFVSRGGAEMFGNISGVTPTSAAHLTRKDYVDAAVAGRVATNDPRLTDARTPLAHTHAIGDVTELQSALDAKASATVVNAGDFKLVPDGVTDNISQLQAAMLAVPAGGTLFIPPGTYAMSGTVSNSNKPVRVSAYGATFINTEAGTPFSFSGGFETVYPVSAITDVTIAETETNNPGVQVTLGDGVSPGWRKGDAVKLVSDDPIPGGRPELGTSQRRLGQCLFVQSCEGNVVTLMGSLDDPMTTNLRIARFKETWVTFEGATLDTLAGRTVPPASVTLAASAITDNLLTLSAARSTLYTAAPVVFSGTGLPTGITAGTEYYVIPVSDTTMRIASTKANARAGTALAVSGTPGTVTALFKSWGGSMVAFASVRNLSMRDVKVIDSPNQAFSFNGCFGGHVENIEVKHCYDNIYTGAFGYGVNMSCSTGITIENYRAGRVRHAYTDDSTQIAAGSGNFHSYGRTKNCGVKKGYAQNTSNTAWDTHHNGIYGFFEDVYAEDCNIAVSFRGRSHRARNVFVKNVRIAVRAFTETDGGESWGHSFDGVYGQALQVFTIDLNRTGGPSAGIREDRLTTIKNVNLTGLYRSIGTVTNATAQLENFRIEYGPSIENSYRLLDFDNADVVLQDFEVDLRKLTSGSSLRFLREVNTNGYFRFTKLRVRANSDITARFNRTFETPTDMTFEVTDATFDYVLGGIVGGTPGSTILEYKIVVGSSDNSEYIRVADTDVSGGLASRELRKTRKSPVLINVAPSTDTTLGAFYDGKLRGQIVHLRNSGTANVTLTHGSATKLVLRGGVDKVLPPGDGLSLVYIPAVGWCELDNGQSGASSVAWPDVTGKPSTFPPEPHAHAIADVTGLQAALDAELSLSGGTLNDGANIAVGTSAGTKLGTATTQKLGFFNATPVVQPTATTDLGTVLSSLGLRAAGTAFPLSTSGSVNLSGTVTTSKGRIKTPGAMTAATTLATSSGEMQTADATAAAFNVTLPATTTAGYHYTIKKIDASANAVTVLGTIDGATNYVLSRQYEFVTLMSTTTSGVWRVLASSRTDWNSIANRPSTFAPSAHTHAVADVTGLQTALDGKAPASHTHAIGDVTGLQTALDGKAPTSHTHTTAQISDATTLGRDLMKATDAAAARTLIGAGTGGGGSSLPAPIVTMSAGGQGDTVSNTSTAGAAAATNRGLRIPMTFFAKPKRFRFKVRNFNCTGYGPAGNAATGQGISMGVHAGNFQFQNGQATSLVSGTYAISGTASFWFSDWITDPALMPTPGVEYLFATGYTQANTGTPNMAMQCGLNTNAAAAIAGANTAMTAAWTPLDFQIEYEVDESVLRVLVVADSINEGITGPPGTSASNVVPQPLSTAPPNRWAASVGAVTQLHAVAGISTLNFVNIPDLFDRMNIEQLRPHIILWALGANDLMGSTTVTGAEFVTNMGSALAIVRSRVGYGPRLYVNNVMPRGGITAAQQTSRTNFNAAIAARPHGAVAMIDMDSAMRNPASTNAILPALTNDTIHPSYEGQQVMADVYRNTLPSVPPAVTASPTIYPTMTQAQYDALGASRDPNGIYPIRG